MNCANCGHELVKSEEVCAHKPPKPTAAREPEGESTRTGSPSLGIGGSADSENLAIASASRPEYRVKLLAPNGSILRIDPALIVTRPTELPPNSPIFPVDESAVSRKHLWIGCACNDLVFVDLGSTNGTSINGERLAPFHPHARRYRNERIEVQLGKSYQFSIDVEPLQ